MKFSARSPCCDVLSGSIRSLVGRKVLLIGGSKGIGKACVDEMLALGANVVTCARDEKDLQQCLESPEWSPYVQSGKISAVVADVATDEGRERLYEFCRNEFGSLMHGLVNNVGFNIRLKCEDFSEGR